MHLQKRAKVASRNIEQAVYKGWPLLELARALSQAEQLLGDVRKAAEMMAEAWRIRIRSEGHNPHERVVWRVVGRIAEEVAVCELTTKGRGGFSCAARFVGSERACELLAETIRRHYRRNGMQPDEREVARLVREAIRPRAVQGTGRNTEF